MKKLILGISLVLISSGVLASLYKEEELKASDQETATSHSVTADIRSTSAESGGLETVPSTEVDTQILEEELPASDEATPSPPAKERTGAPSSYETSSSVSASSTKEQVTEESSTQISSSSNESTTIDSSSEGSTSSTSMSTASSSTSSSSQSTETRPSTSATSNNSIKESTGNSKEPISGTASEENSNKLSELSHAVPAPSMPPLNSRQGPGTSTPALSSVPAYKSPIPTIGNTSPLGDREIELAGDLKVREVAESEFNGYELPLLSSFTDKNQAILIYEGLRQLGEKDDEYTTEKLLNDLYSKLFDQEIVGAVTESVVEKDFQPGDILLVKKERIGLYLGDDRYLTVKKVAIEDTKESKKIGVGFEMAELKKATEISKRDYQKVVVACLSERSETEPIEGQRVLQLAQTDYAKEIEASYPASFPISINEQTQKFVKQIGKDAQKLGLDYDVFASVMIAQAILESGSGSSGLSTAPNYNLFGVKGTYNGQSVQMGTKEDRGNGELYTITAAFRKYPSYTESLGDYVTLIRGGISGNDGYYQEAWRSEAKNYLRAATSLTGKYATDTTYHRKLSSIIAAYHLTQYDEKIPDNAKESVSGLPSSGLFLQGKETIPEEYRKKMTLPDYNGKNYNVSGSYPVGQCTWYAYNRVVQLGGQVDDYMGNGGEWGVKGRRLGYEVSQQPKIGYVISFKPGVAGSDPRYGHVAIVEAVTDSGILISEGNVVGGTVISYRIIPNELAKSDLVSYIKPKR